MTAAPLLRPGAAAGGILFALGGSVFLSVNDLAIKFLSPGHALHQIILVRTLVGFAVILAVIALTRTGLGQLRTRRPLDHLVRVALVMVSNVSYFLGLAVLPLAEAVAVAFAAPLLVTALSALILKEPVDRRRWAAVATGLLGVLIVVRPGAATFQPAALLCLLSALCYASTHLMTRRMRRTESAMSLNFHVQIGFLVVSCAMGLWVGDGHLAGSDRPVLQFLFRPWVWPAPEMLWAFAATGLAVGLGGLMVSEAYRRAEASAIAPFEYIGMPMAILWDWLVFGHWPEPAVWAGVALICGAGAATLWSETRRHREDGA